MEKKIGYCPLCGRDIIITTKASMIYCPNCSHRIDLHPWVLPCKCGALPRIYQEGLAKKDVETKEMFFIETYEYSVECEECGYDVYARYLDDAVYAWNEGVGE